MQGLIPQAFIDELIQRIDIIEFIDSYVPLKKRGTSYVACCPFHNEKNALIQCSCEATILPLFRLSGEWECY